MQRKYIYFFGRQNLGVYTGIPVWKSFWIRHWKGIRNFPLWFVIIRLYNYKSRSFVYASVSKFLKVYWFWGSNGKGDFPWGIEASGGPEGRGVLEVPSSQGVPGVLGPSFPPCPSPARLMTHSYMIFLSGTFSKLELWTLVFKSLNFSFKFSIFLEKVFL